MAAEGRLGDRHRVEGLNAGGFKHLELIPQLVKLGLEDAFGVAAVVQAKNTRAAEKYYAARQETGWLSDAARPTSWR